MTSPAGINCGATCSASLNYNTPVTLIPTPATNSTFDGWGGDTDCTDSSVVGSVTIIITGSVACTANFNLITYWITPTAGTGGDITPGTPQPVDWGGSATFTVTADTGYHILDVGVDGASQGPISAYTFTNVTANHTLTATFNLIPITYYTLTVATVGNGSVTPTTGSYISGAVVPITATANPESIFAGWSGDLSGSVNPTSITMTGDKSITATFNLNPILTVSKAGAGTSSGTVSSNPAGIDCGTDCIKDYALNTTVTLTATANPTSTFTGWSGDLSGNTNPITITMTGDKTVIATFTQAQGALINLDKTVSSPTAQRGDTLTYQLVLGVISATVTANLTDTLPVSLTYVSGSVTGGATYTSGQIRYNGPVTPGSDVVITYRARVNNNVPLGSILINTAVVTGAGRLEESSVAVAVPVPNDGFNKTLFLLYLGGDGNLADTMLDLLNEAETEADNPNAVILAVLDGPGANDSVLYRLQHDHDPACPNYSNPTCDGLYVPGQNFWVWPENTGSPYSLAEFLTSAELAYPKAEQVLVRIAGHGDGWAATIPGVQPIWHGGQPGGLLWDDHPGSSFNTEELGNAFAWTKQATKRTVDLLYLDACLMGAAPVADALRHSVDTLLASESLEWTNSTPIAEDIAAIDDSLTARQLGELWLRHGAAMLTPGDYPYTYSLIDVSKIHVVRTEEKNLANALIPLLPAYRPQIEATWTLAGCFDSSGNGLIEPEDNLCDLSVWAGEIAAQFSGDANVVSKADNLQRAVAAAVISETHHNGDFIYSGQTWAWGALGGLSEYLPLRADNWQRPYYPTGSWHDFLDAYWGNATPPQPPICTTGNCPPSDPPAPIAIQAQAAAGLNNIAASWYPIRALPRLSGYQLYRNANGGIFSPITTTLQSQYIDNDPTLIPGVDYCYQIKAVDDANAVLGVSNIVCVQFGGLTLSIPHIFAAPGSSALVPVNVSQADGVCIGAMGTTIQYDPAIAVPTGQVSPTIYTSGYTFTAYTGIPGQIRIVSIGSCQPLYGGGSLFWVPFSVSGQTGAVSPLDFIQGLTNTYLYDSSDLQTPVTLTLRNGSLTVQNAYIRGDVNGDGDGVVNAADALLALNIASGQITPTPPQLSACDVNGDGFCTAADSTLILCYAATPNWNLCGVNVPIGLLRAAAATGPVELAIRRISGSQGQQVSVPLRITDGPEMAGGEFAFTYNRNLLTFDAATPTTGFILATTAQPGLVRLALASNTPIGGDGELATLRFTLNTAVRDESLILGAVRLNDAAGRDFVTSALQKTLVFKIDPALTTIYLPLVRR